jgi:type III restriction enzyme
MVTNATEYLRPKKSPFNRVVGDSGFELEFAKFLDRVEIISFAKNHDRTGFGLEYVTADNGISRYYPDFIVKETEAAIWIIETKGATQAKDFRKWERLKQWCADVNRETKDGRTFDCLFVEQEIWEQHPPTSFGQMVQLFQGREPRL